MTATRKDYYKLLNIQQDSTEDQIKKAYHLQLLKFHPDKHRYSSDLDIVTKQAQDIIEAHHVLSNPRRRQIYDLGGSPDTSENINVFNEDPQIKDNYSFEDEKALFKRNPNAKRDPDFKYREFVNLICTKAFYGYIFEALEDLKDNVVNMEACNFCGKDTINILTCFAAEDRLDLVTMFSSEWLKKADNFGHTSWLGEFLACHIPIEDWKIFLDHLGSDWVKLTVAQAGISSILGKLTGNFAGFNNLKYRERQVDALLSYLGQEWLRLNLSSIALGTFLSDHFYKEDVEKVLKIIDGNEKWIQKKYEDGVNLGYILEGLIPYIPQKNSYDFFRSSTQLVDNVQKDWENFLKTYMSPSWKEKCIDNPVEFNRLLGRLDEREYSTEKFELFLVTYLDKTKFLKLEDLINVLSPSSEEKFENTWLASGPLSRKKSLAFIQHFTENEMHSIVFKNRTFSEVLSLIDQYKSESIYSALLFAVAQACYCERNEKIDQSTSIRETIWAHTPWSSSTALKLHVLKNVMKYIEEHKDIPSIPGLSEVEEARQITKRYMESRHPTKTHVTSHALLLK